MEEWKEISGYEGYYEVSSYGNVRTMRRDVERSDGVILHYEPKICNQRLDYNGYPVVKLSKNAKSRYLSVHRLVAQVFVDGYFDNAEVDHIDCDRTNNNANNLRWLTHKDNISRIFESGNHVSQKYDYTGSNNPNYHNSTLHERYLNDKQFAIDKQSRPGKQNGRCIPISLILPSGEELVFDYLTECASYLINSGYTKSKNKGYIATKLRKSAQYGQDYLGFKPVLHNQTIPCQADNSDTNAEDIGRCND